MVKVATFGEVMLRLKSPGFERFFQSKQFEATFGGGEANVAVSLANYGMQSKFITALPDHDLSRACLNELRGLGVDVSAVLLKKSGRLGIYFLETGANQRASKVVYDRECSAIAQAKVDDFDFEEALFGCSWLHITGITPALSKSAAELSKRAVSVAKQKGLTVSCDLNYRKNLWNYGESVQEVMSCLVSQSDVIVANEEDIQMSLGICSDVDVTSGELPIEAYKQLAQKTMQGYPNLKKIAITLRESKSASHNDWAACLFDGDTLHVSKKYQIKNIVDRVGGGDSFSGGLIYGLNHYEDVGQALEFATAASCLKHSIVGDYNRSKLAEVTALMSGDASGRVQR